MSTINIKFEITEHPYHGGSLRDALVKIRGNKCEDCGLTEWKNQPIPLEAHHIDGNKCNNKLENLQLLCPNCHTLTPNYGSKNHNKKEITDEQLIKALQEHPTIRQALFSLGMSDAGANYSRVKSIIQNNPNLNILKEKIFKNNNNNNNYSIIKTKKCPKCGKYIGINSFLCQECNSIAQRTVERPNREVLKQEIYEMPFTQIANKYGVSDNAIRKWCKAYNLPTKKSEIKKYTKEEWIQL